MMYKIEHKIFDGCCNCLESYQMEADSSIEVLKKAIGDFSEKWYTVEEVDGSTIVNFVSNPIVYNNGIEEDYYIITPIN